RVKKIGIRKVLGTCVQDLVLLLSKTFSLLILIAFVIAAPLSWQYLAGWLDGFAYRIDIQILSFVLGE
ncbi:MAG: putative ABC transport system permease protein, partial [Cyclobacteriaceae bacterium]